MPGGARSCQELPGGASGSENLTVRLSSACLLGPPLLMGSVKNDKEDLFLVMLSTQQNSNYIVSKQRCAQLLEDKSAVRACLMGTGKVEKVTKPFAVSSAWFVFLYRLQNQVVIRQLNPPKAKI